jgi:transcriptional regulator with XRE-family HTH domain
MKSHRQFVQEQIENEPKFAKLLDEAQLEVDIAVELAKLREQRGVTQTEVAHRTGLKQPQIARLESGAHLPTLDTLHRVLQVLGGKMELGPTGVCEIKAVQRVGRAMVVGMKRRRQYAGKG